MDQHENDFDLEQQHNLDEQVAVDDSNDYQFATEDDTDESAYVVDDKPNGGNLVRIIVPVVILAVVGFGGYHLIKHFHHKSQHASKISQSTTGKQGSAKTATAKQQLGSWHKQGAQRLHNQPLATMKPMTKPNAQVNAANNANVANSTAGQAPTSGQANNSLTATATEQNQVATTTSSAKVAANVKELKKNLAKLQKPLQQLQSQYGQLTNTAQNNSTQLQQVEQTETDLTHAVAKLTASVNEINANLKKQQRARMLAKKRAHYPTYYVNAVIPGRAWLVATNGKSTTVKVGNKLPGYGRIMQINPTAGTVRTSSGRIIRYGIIEG